MIWSIVDAESATSEAVRPGQRRTFSSVIVGQDPTAEEAGVAAGRSATVITSIGKDEAPAGDFFRA